MNTIMVYSPNKRYLETSSYDNNKFIVIYMNNTIFDLLMACESFIV